MRDRKARRETGRLNKTDRLNKAGRLNGDKQTKRRQADRETITK